jgi:hypothetical protein
VEVLVESVSATKAAEARADRADRRTTVLAFVALAVAIVFGVLTLVF